MPKPPVLPPRNPLATATGGIGKRAPLPYREALRRREQKRRVQGIVVPKAKAQGGPLGMLMPNKSPREAAKHLLIGLHEPANRKAARRAEEARQRMRDEMRLAGFDDDLMDLTAVNDPAPDEAASNRAPRREAGRYDGLKNAGREPG